LDASRRFSPRLHLIPLWRVSQRAKTPSTNKRGEGAVVVPGRHRAVSAGPRAVAVVREVDRLRGAPDGLERRAGLEGACWAGEAKSVTTS
jgi:hypothetical protein